MSNPGEPRGVGNTVIQRQKSLDTWYTYAVVVKRLFTTFPSADPLPSIPSATKHVKHPCVDVESQQLPPPRCRSGGGHLPVW